MAIAIGAWSITGNSGTPDPALDLHYSYGCPSQLTTEGGRRVSGAWSGILLFDCVIFCLTLKKAISYWSAGEARLMHLLLRDGTLFFAAMFFASLSNILTLLLGPPLIKGLTTTFSDIVSTTLLSRLMLNVRNPVLHRPMGLAMSTRRTTFALDFRSRLTWRSDMEEGD